MGGSARAETKPALYGIYLRFCKSHSFSMNKFTNCCRRSLIALFLLSFALLFYQCERSEYELNEEYELVFRSLEYEKFDRIKIAISLSIANIAAEDASRLNSLLSLVRNEPDRRILAVDFAGLQIEGVSLEQLIINNLEEEDLEFEEHIRSLCEEYPHLSISLPLWYDAIPVEYRDDIEYAVFPGIYDFNSVWAGIDLQNNQTVSLSEAQPYQIVPVRVAEAEDIIPFDQNQLTINGDPLLETHFPHTAFCSEAVAQINDFLLPSECSTTYDLLDIMAFRDHLREECLLSFTDTEICDNGLDDDGDGLVDSEDPDCQEATPEICNNGIDDDGDGAIDGNDPDCVMGGEICTNGTDDDGDGLIDGLDPDCNPGQEVCNNFFDDDGDGLIDGDDPDCACETICERDCVTEKNVVEGVKFISYSVFKGINNQPGGEDVISLHYTIVASQMCGDPKVSGSCPPSTWKKVFWGTFSDFFTLEVEYGTPPAADLGNIVYQFGSFIYIVAVPKYFDIPNENSEEGIYSQLPYLQNTALSHWDGDVCGNVVTFSIHEHDEVVVEQTIKNTIKVTNSSEVSLSLKFPFLKKEGQFDFSSSSTVEKTAEYTYEIEAEKDVELGQHASVYCDQNFENEEIEYGIYKSTGSIISHLAFWY